jgi:hypothetical protein
VNRVVLVERPTELFPEFGDLPLLNVPDGGFECNHAEIHGRARVRRCARSQVWVAQRYASTKRLQS